MTEFPPILPKHGTLADLADPVDVFEEVARRLSASDLRRRVRRLPLAEREALVAKYGLLGASSQRSEVGRGLQLRRGATHRLERRALAHLRASYRDDA